MKTALLLLSLLLMCAGCGNGEPPANAAQARGGNGRPEQPPVPVAVQAAQRGPIASYYTATATLEAEKQAEVLARVGGVVQAIPAEEGDTISAGGTLLRIENDEYRLRVEQAEANTENLRSRFERLKTIAAQNLISAEELDTAERDLKSAEADEGLARLNLSYTRVDAPFSGRVVRRLVDVGQNVSAGTPLFQLADFDPLLARIHVPAKQFGRLDVGQDVQLKLHSSQVVLAGTITLVSPVIDTNTGTIKLTVEIPQYPDGVRPGDFAEVNIVTERRPNALLVPKTAVFTDKGEDVVYVAVDDLAERRVVEQGFVDDANAEIVSGVSAGERVVVRGQRSLRHGAPLRILDDAAAPATASR